MSLSEPHSISDSPRSLPESFQQMPALWHFCQQIGPCPLRYHPSPKSDPYAALVRAVVGQQLHEKAARQIYARLCALGTDGQLPIPEHMRLLDRAVLRACGLSAAKADTVPRLAQARLDGLLPSLQEAQNMEDTALITRLTTIKGIGRWTVEMMLIFTLGRPDVLPAGDLGVQEGWRRLQGAAKRLTAAKLLSETATFSPHRSQLTWYCWQAKEKLPA